MDPRVDQRSRRVLRPVMVLQNFRVLVLPGDLPIFRVLLPAAAPRTFLVHLQVLALQEDRVRNPVLLQRISLVIRPPPGRRGLPPVLLRKVLQVVRRVHQVQVRRQDPPPDKPRNLLLDPSFQCRLGRA